MGVSWETRMAVAYYRRLHKEYAICDLSQYREGKLGLRWRTEREVLSGKGQFECGAKGCEERQELHSYEVNFKYKEEGASGQQEIKNELVKVRLCASCAEKLYYKKIKALRKLEKKEAKKQKGRQKSADTDNTTEQSAGHARVLRALAVDTDHASEEVQEKSKHGRNSGEVSSSKKRKIDDVGAGESSTHGSRKRIPTDSGCASGDAVDASAMWSKPLEQERGPTDDIADFIDSLFP